MGRTMAPDFFDDVLEHAKGKMKRVEAAELYMEYASNWAAEGHLFPHCDERVLHSPGLCEFCDKAEVLQKYRQMLNLSYTDELQANDPLLPGEDRSRASADAWGGNRKDGYEWNERFNR